MSKSELITLSKDATLLCEREIIELQQWK